MKTEKTPVWRWSLLPALIAMFWIMGTPSPFAQMLGEMNAAMEGMNTLNSASVGPPTGTYIDRARDVASPYPQAAPNYPVPPNMMAPPISGWFSPDQ